MAKVFLDYDQQALDAAYDQAVYAPNRDQILARLAHTSELVRRRLGAPERFSYGEKPIEGLDVYRTAKPNAPIGVFVHGGAWRAGLARDYAFAAEMLVRAGAPPRRHPRAGRAALRLARDARVPAPVARFRRCPDPRGKGGRDHPRRGLQPLRDRRDPRQSLRPARPRAARADEARFGARVVIIQ